MPDIEFDLSIAHLNFLKLGKYIGYIYDTEGNAYGGFDPNDMADCVASAVVALDRYLRNHTESIVILAYRAKYVVLGNVIEEMKEVRLNTRRWKQLEQTKDRALFIVATRLFELQPSR